MNFYLKQHVLTWGDQFTIYDEQGKDCYYGKGEIFSWGKKLHILDLTGRELAFIRQKLFTFRAKYTIEQDGKEVAEVIRRITWFRPVYEVTRLGWMVEGDFLAHAYRISHGKRTVAEISKHWFTFGDAYELCINPEVDPVSALAVILAVDACTDND